MTCFNPIIRKEIISAILVLIPHTIPIPSVNINNFLHQAASDIVNILKTPQPILPTSLQIGNQVRNGLFQLATIQKTNKANSILTNTRCHLQSPNHNTLIPSKHLTQQNKSFHEGFTSLQLAFHKLQTLLLTLKTKHILKHTQTPIPTVNHIYDNDGNRLTLDHLHKTDNKK